MSKLDTANFRGQLDNTKLKYFLSALDREVKEYVEIYLAQQGTEQIVLTTKAALKERFENKNKKVRNFNKVLVLKQNGTVREYNQKFLKFKFNCGQILSIKSTAVSI